MKKLSAILLLLTTFLFLGCANEWREADAQLSPQELDEYLSEFASASASNNHGAHAQALVLLEERPDATVYFADAPGPLGTVASVLSLVDFGFLGADGVGLKFWDIMVARVYFVDVPSTGENALILGIQKYNSEMHYYSFVGRSVLEEDYYEVAFDTGNGTQLTLTSDDVVDGELDAVIQLRAYFVNAQGVESSIGQLSTLVGFGPN